MYVLCLCYVYEPGFGPRAASLKVKKTLFDVCVIYVTSVCIIHVYVNSCMCTCCYHFRYCCVLCVLYIYIYNIMYIYIYIHM